MRIYVYVLLVFCSNATQKAIAAIPHGRVVRQAAFGHSCTTPDGKVGTCISLQSCSTLFHLLKTDGRNPETAHFLKKSQCGRLFVNEMPVVCCADATPTSTPKPDTSGPMTLTSMTSKPTRPPVNYECGKSDRQEMRIVNGTNASLDDWPWMVALGYQSTNKNTNSSNLDFKCGATLISNKWVITAAHCVTNLGNSKLTHARLGDLNLDADVEDGASPVDIPIEKIIPHPLYTTYPIVNDIALLRLRNTVKFNMHIRPVCLMSKKEYKSDTYYTGQKPYIIGWGAIEWRGPASSILLQAEITVVNLTDCAKIYANKPEAKIDHRVLCAGENGRDTCQGDSGGPLIFPIIRPEDKQLDAYYLGGIVSFGVKCADLTYPGVYTRIAAFTAWISETTGLPLDED